MTIYLNPKRYSKEEWLIYHSVETSREDISFEYEMIRRENKVPVCLVNNGHFTVAAILLSKFDFRCFTSPNDTRPKKWFVVPVPALSDDSGVSTEILKTI